PRVLAGAGRACPLSREIAGGGGGGQADDSLELRPKRYIVRGRRDGGAAWLVGRCEPHPSGPSHFGRRDLVRSLRAARRARSPPRFGVLGRDGAPARRDAVDL